MSTNYQQLMSLKIPDVHGQYSEKDTMLYALSLGVGADPLDEHELALVYEKQLKALPTLAVVLAHPGFWPRDLDSGLDWMKIVHGGQKIKLHRPLPTSGTVVGRSNVREVIDKGPGKGALVYFERQLFDAENNQLLVTMEQTLFCRGDGGMGGSGNTAPVPHPIPHREPDCSMAHFLLPQAALLYRLNGDMNPLHADPTIAKAAGFDRPILQGLATMGVATLALVKNLCDGDPRRIIDMDLRFTAPCYPGEALLVELWREDSHVSFRVSVPARGVTVIDNGLAHLAPA